MCRPFFVFTTRYAPRQSVNKSLAGPVEFGQGQVHQLQAPEHPPMSLPAALTALDGIILGKPRALRLALACLLARGHLLIEDVPGVGKTTLAHALAQVLGLAWQRVQFTSDLLPADILGVSIFDRNTQKFDFRQGPVFTQLLLADEVNRASPRTQSALLEAMEERQVSVDGITHPLPEPFFVVATQNPQEQLGTYQLPESQLDRFLMRIELGYPDPRHERALLAQTDRRELLAHMKPSMDAAALMALQQQAARVHVADPLFDYVQKLVAATRARVDIRLGLSPRAAQGLVRAARAWALIEGRGAVLPDDVQAVWPAVAGHRLESRGGSGVQPLPSEQLLRAVLEAVPVPR
jgi:MoxR-like ATPase